MSHLNLPLLLYDTAVAGAMFLSEEPVVVFEDDRMKLVRRSVREDVNEEETSELWDTMWNVTGEVGKHSFATARFNRWLALGDTLEVPSALVVHENGLVIGPDGVSCGSSANDEFTWHIVVPVDEVVAMQVLVDMRNFAKHINTVLAAN